MSAVEIGYYNFMSQDNLDEANAIFGLPSPEVLIYPGPYGPGNYPDQPDGYLGRFTDDCDDCVINLVESNMDVQMLAQYGPGGDVGFIPSMDGLAPGF